MISTLNVSSVIVRCYPETAPWDLTHPVFGVHPSNLAAYKSSLPEYLRKAALEQALQTGLNPFYFVFGSNPFVLDNPALQSSAYRLSPANVSPLTHFEPQESQTVAFESEIGVKDGCAVCRVRIGSGTRVLKLYLGSDAEVRFSAEAAAYARFHHFQLAESGAVPGCYGWIEVDRGFLETAQTSQGASRSLRDTICAFSAHTAPGILLEDLSGAEALSIHNITPQIADDALRSLRLIHTCHILHGTPMDSRNIMLLPDTGRVIWVGLSQSTCYEFSGAVDAVTRANLLAELAQGWNLLYQGMLPDSLIGLEATASSVINPSDTTIKPTISTHSLSIPVLPRPSCDNIRDEIISLLFPYPEVNVFSWSPPIFNLLPAPKFDHQYDTDEFLQALRATPGMRWVMEKWYGPCPLSIFHTTFQRKETPLGFSKYVVPALVPQLPSNTPIRFIEHLCPSGHHALMRVRIGSQDRVLKIFSKDRLAYVEDYKTAKQRFEIERDAYAHFLHYGVCESGAVPRCYGWIELSATHVYDALDMIRQTRERGVLDDGAEPVWVSPIFEDGSFAAALVLEYLPNAEAISVASVTRGRAELALRALSRVHGAYVLHGDLRNPNNLQLVRGGNGDGTGDRVVVIDFDLARTPGTERYLWRGDMLGELRDLWIYLYRTLSCQCDGCVARLVAIRMK